MEQQLAGAFRFIRVAGIQVHVHWTWFLMFVVIARWDRGFESPIWNVLAALSIFAVVLLHEFGHALACRSVGGRADHIMLWPLGGVAFVQPPERPGAVLWSIAAGPLVNVLLIPVLLGAYLVLRQAYGETDLVRFVEWLQLFNVIILIFNMLPIYPLDGGQILQSLLWFVIGYTSSLQIAAGLGMVFAVLGGAFALWMGNTWLVVLAVFVAWQAWIGWQQAKARMYAGERRWPDRESDQP